MVSDKTRFDILDHVSSFKFSCSRPLDRRLEVHRDEYVLPGLLSLKMADVTRLKLLGVENTDFLTMEQDD